MLELLAYLRANGFKTFIVSGGGIEFMRPWTESVYGIPPEQVVGSSIETKFEVRDGKPVLVRLPELDFVDDGAGKPVGIQRHIGRRPLAAFGNSDGDLEMLQWTAAGAGPRFCLFVHHTDAEREWAYDRETHVGRLDKGLDEAKTRGWTVVEHERRLGDHLPAERCQVERSSGPAGVCHVDPPSLRCLGRLARHGVAGPLPWGGLTAIQFRRKRSESDVAAAFRAAVASATRASSSLAGRGRPRRLLPSRSPWCCASPRSCRGRAPLRRSSRPARASSGPSS